MIAPGDFTTYVPQINIKGQLLTNVPGMKIAVCGCCHGCLDIVYKAIEEEDFKSKEKTAFLLCCGDFQAVRDRDDLKSLNCPTKYKKVGDFLKYYNGQCTAPLLTIFIGGNHEASNVLQELYYGGWVAPNIFYLGTSGVITIGNEEIGFLRVAGLSGIYKSHDYNRGYYEIPPYDRQSIRSIYHIRKFEIDKLLAIRQPIDIMMTHDWPQGVERYGNCQELLKKKPFFKADIDNNSLGNPVTVPLMQQLQPRYWFSAHLHVKFAASIPLVEPLISDNRDIQFLALDKPFPGRRQFIEFIDIPVLSNQQSSCLTQLIENDTSLQTSSIKILYDVEWLGILKQNHHLCPIGASYVSPGKDSLVRSPTIETIQAINQFMMLEAQQRHAHSAHSNDTLSQRIESDNQCCLLEWVQDIAAITDSNFEKQRLELLHLMDIHEDTLFEGLRRLNKNQPYPTLTQLLPVYRVQPVAVPDRNTNETTLSDTTNELSFSKITNQSSCTEELDICL